MNVEFLKALLSTPGPSGDEAAPARVWRNEAARFADAVSADVRGNSLAVLNGGAPRVLLDGHIDEIGLMVAHIDEDGYLYFAGIGGWDSQVLVGQRVRLLGRTGEVLGVIGKKPIHLQKDDRDKVSKLDDLWIDIGAKSKAEALERVRLGAVGVIDAPIIELPNGRIVARSIDNRIGAFVVLEALRRLAADRPAVTVAALAAAQEEIGGAGASVAAFAFEPQVAIVVDVTFATDSPGSDKRRWGDVKLGGGPVLSRGSANSPVLYDMLLEAAEAEDIPYAVQITPRYTATDADNIHLARGGVAAAVVSVPNRYMHSPNEMIDLVDVEHTINLLVALVRRLGPDTDFVPR
jgi:putative aminopeptidase FrvX